MAEYNSKTTVRMRIVPSTNPLPDVLVVVDGNGGATQRHWALTGCPYGTKTGRHPERRCSSFIIWVYQSGIGTNRARWDHVACRELGHTLGLHHREAHPNLGGPFQVPSCMVSPTGGRPLRTDLDGIDVLTIREGYPAS